MALSRCCYCYYIISVLLIVNSTQVRYSAEGRALLKSAEVAKEESEGDWTVSVSSMIGSRPPRCERRCIACGRCEAVQVPVVPPQVKHFTRNAIDSRAEDHSNYKPMGWKCKCGNMILDP